MRSCRTRENAHLISIRQVSSDAAILRRRTALLYGPPAAAAAALPLLMLTCMCIGNLLIKFIVIN